ncbi:MAG: hypothetical protein ACI87E_005285, partial [Mariniblastus sp.]
ECFSEKHTHQEDVWGIRRNSLKAGTQKSVGKQIVSFVFLDSNHQTRVD